MRELEKKQRVRRAMYSTPAIVILLLILVVLAKGAWEAVGKERESARRVTELEAKVGELEGRRADLENDIVRLGTTEGQKEELRSRFNLVAECEKFVVLVDPEGRSEQESTPSDIWYREWWNWFLDLWRE